MKGVRSSGEPGLSWGLTQATLDWASDYFWAHLEDRSIRFLPQAAAPVFLASLGQLIARRDDPAGRRALLAVLGRAYQRYGLQSYHDTVIAAAMVGTIRHLAGSLWDPQFAAAWQLGCRRALRLANRAAGHMGSGPPFTFAEVESRDKAADGVTTLTVRPQKRLRYLPGQAIAVCTPRRPGVWRWYSPANAPRPDGTVELHVRAVAQGVVSPVLVEQVLPGEMLWLGPALDTGLSLDAAGEADLLLAAGGTGLAPLRALVEEAAGGWWRRVTLVVGARTVADLYDAVALDKLREAHHGWLEVVLAFSHDSEVDAASQADLLTMTLNHHRPGQAVYVCGPPGLIEAARFRLPAAGVASDRLHLAPTFLRRSAVGGHRKPNHRTLGS
ncbi:FAD-binding oxidoreductase [Micromonospora sp. NPDC048063]|uniref:FAD-binding oxidoreductase n=1 Tax=Micromonospora sp. NPDC048063 TaxID=3364256 RepID=UPI0037248817